MGIFSVSILVSHMWKVLTFFSFVVDSWVWKNNVHGFEGKTLLL